MLEGCKWDAQVGDACTLAPFPLVMKRQVWHRLAALAERLTVEVMAAEEEIARRPDLLRLLGLPTALQNVLADNQALTPAAGRVIRYDFHFTKEGWQISEANSDVPGGFTEASYFTRLMAEQFPEFELAGNPANTWSDALAATAGPDGRIALASAAGYLEDHQVVAFLANQLTKRGCQTYLVKPEQIQWRDGRAFLDACWHHSPVDTIVRFYQAEWLSKLPAETGWRHFFRGGKTPVANPPLAVISESKRFPLTWKHLNSALPAWKRLLPETRDPREMFWLDDRTWLLKTAMCNTGDTVSIRQLMPPGRWWRTKWQSRFSPGNWIAQRRFESIPLDTPEGPRHVCLGIYTINGRAAGAYTRLAEKPVIDFAAVDAALLLEKDKNE